MRVLIFTLTCLLLSACASTQQIDPTNKLPNQPKILFFVGEYKDSDASPEDTKLMMLGIKYRYKILQAVTPIDQPTIDFYIQSEQYPHPLDSGKPMAILLLDFEGRLYHGSLFSYPFIHQLNNGDYASCGNYAQLVQDLYAVKLPETTTSNFNFTETAQFKISDKITDLSTIQTHDVPYYQQQNAIWQAFFFGGDFEIKGDIAYCKKGNNLGEIFEIEKYLARHTIKRISK